MKKDERSKGGISDEQLDKMIDESVQRQKKEEKVEKKEERKREEPKKEEKREEKGKAATSAPAAAPAAAPKPITEYDPWGILRFPNLAEKAMNMVELENKLVFVVRKDASKRQIKEAVEKGFDVKVLQVNVEVTQKGQKKAYIKLDPKDSAADIASRMGML